MKNQSILKIEKLLRKGVKIPNPDSVEIGSEVDTDRISGEGVVVYSGCKIFGLKSSGIIHSFDIVKFLCQSNLLFLCNFKRKNEL